MAHAEHNGRRSHTRQARRLTNTGHALRYVRPSLSPLCLSRDSCSSSSFSPQHQRRWNGVRPQQLQLSQLSQSAPHRTVLLSGAPAAVKAAYDMAAELLRAEANARAPAASAGSSVRLLVPHGLACLLYTSDAADE